MNNMRRNKKKPDGSEYLAAGIGYFLAWTVVAMVLVNEYMESGGIANIHASVLNGDYYPVMLLIGSVVLLALFIRNVSFFLRARAKKAGPDQ